MFNFNDYEKYIYMFTQINGIWLHDRGSAIAGKVVIHTRDQWFLS